MDILEIIEAKKHGRQLTPDAIASVVQEFTADRLPSYQMAAWLMAVWFAAPPIQVPARVVSPRQTASGP